MSRRNAFLRLRGQRAYVATPLQRNPYSDFTSGTPFFLNTGWSVSGGKIIATATPQFELFEHAFGYRFAISPSRPYDIKITCDSMTGGPKLVRFLVGYQKGQDNDPASSIRSGDTSDSFSLGAAADSPIYTVIPPADCTHITLVLQYMDTGTLTAQFDNFTMTG